LKYEFISSRNVGEQSFVKCGQTNRQRDRQTGRTTNQRTGTSTGNKLASQQTSTGAH